MKFLNEAGQEITLKRSTTLPGYEVTLAEDTVIDSAVNNPFFKGINILQLPKKLKGFRDNPDLKTLLEPKPLFSNLKLDVETDVFTVFVPSQDLVDNKRLILTTNIFGSNDFIRPKFINLSLKKVKINAGTVIGTLIVQKAIID